MFKPVGCYDPYVVQQTDPINIPILSNVVMLVAITLRKYTTYYINNTPTL